MIEWADKNGIKFPKLEYPHKFEYEGGTYIGTIAKEDINEHEVILSVPLKCILSPLNIYQDEDLHNIVTDYPGFFTPDMYGEDNILILILISELQKDKESFWYPWL